MFIEDGAVHIYTSLAARIKIFIGNRYTRCQIAKEGDLTYARFPPPKVCGYFRLEVQDRFGKTAYTNPCFEEEL